MADQPSVAEARTTLRNDVVAFGKAKTFIERVRAMDLVDQTASALVAAVRAEEAAEIAALRGAMEATVADLVIAVALLEEVATDPLAWLDASIGRLEAALAGPGGEGGGT